MRHIPNLITLSRLIMAVGLLLFPVGSAGFYAVYAYCCLSDCADGFLARRWKVQSIKGARLGSAADTLLFVILLYRILPLMNLALAEWLGILLITLLRIAAAVVTRVRHGHFGFLHTWGNKLTGAGCAIYPFLFRWDTSHTGLWLLGSVALLSAAEELVIESMAQQFLPDCRGIWELCRTGRPCCRRK